MKIRNNSYENNSFVRNAWRDRSRAGMLAGRIEVNKIRHTGSLQLPQDKNNQISFVLNRGSEVARQEDSEKAKALADYDQLLDLVTQLQSSEQSAKKLQPAAGLVTQHRNATSSGDILEFKAFWGQFDGAVHRRKFFDNVTKFVHLKSCLSSEALQLTIGLTVTAENYGELVKLLHDRFHRTTDILDAYINRLFELQPASSHSRKDLLRLHDEINSQLLEIRAIGRDIDTRDTKLISGFRMLLPRLANLLSPRTRTRRSYPSSVSMLSVWITRTTWPTGKHGPHRHDRTFEDKHESTTNDALHASITPKCPCPENARKRLGHCIYVSNMFQIQFKCLQHGHRATECKLKGRIQTTRKPTQKKSCLEDKTEASANVQLTSSHGPTRIRFQTIRAIAHGAEGKRMTVSCLFDSAAERTQREDVAQTLGLAGPIETITILRGGHDDPVAIETTPGWVVFDPVNPSPNPTSQVNCVQIESEIEQTVKKFWELDSIGIKPQDENPSQDSNGKTWYLPHHAVYKTVNGELKCRIVFDGSAIYGGVSLNQCLETGPNLQTDLVGVLLRLRQYQIAVQANIEIMYLQVALRVEDRDACVSCFLWRNCVQDSPVRVYCLPRVCFGLACSPYLAMNVIKAHAEQNPEECDDIIKVPVFLRKRIPPQEVGHPEPQRELLSLAAKVYDPLGYLAPFTVQAKMMFQSLWTLGLSWDQGMQEHETEADPKRLILPGITLEIHALLLTIWGNLSETDCEARVNWTREPAELDDRDETLMTEQKSIKTQPGSSYEKLSRVTAYCLRFIRNIQLPVIERKVDINLSVSELWAAEVRWFRQVQTKEFATTANSAERLKKFQPFLDDQSLMRVGGRLQQSALPPESKHPIILPSHQPLVELLIQDQHVRQLHVDVNQTLVGIRSKFWIFKGRNAVRKVIRSCPVCRRVDAQPYRLRMGNLPADRVTESLPFSHIGVDFAGSLFVRPEVKRCNTQVHKAYICIFTCMTTRAVHLELLKEQTTDSFLQGLRRFIFRSFNLVDQFIQCLFRDSNWKRLQHKLDQERIRWKFITPRAPWCSGYWERLIRSVKNALRKTLRGALLTHDKLHTTICEIEARINDQPIVLTGDNPSDRIA
ncbi:hypothetical protein T06_11700 [Trichinella sp. T6]|nr:hypothetical protein T06_11700 [Trichinella sp. T6]